MGGGGAITNGEGTVVTLFSIELLVSVSVGLKIRRRAYNSGICIGWAVAVLLGFELRPQHSTW